MAHERTWTDEENGTLIQAVSEEYLEQLSSPTTFRIWDLIAANLQDSGVQCTPLEAKVQWDSLAWGYLLIADHSDDCGATVYFDMTAEERTWSGLPPNFPKSWNFRRSAAVQLLHRNPRPAHPWGPSIQQDWRSGLELVPLASSPARYSVPLVIPELIQEWLQHHT
ncbi:hypothetical protein R1sor_019579 [Riccia sorocarpa]|uniref:Myb/SANT-like DNA-binding domain-containing protein n=1 Tax=Riccia sorocarpa TaxID=122646 RepID=A0ABD3IFL6_9MARC